MDKGPGDTVGDQNHHQLDSHVENVQGMAHIPIPPQREFRHVGGQICEGVCPSGWTSPPSPRVAGACAPLGEIPSPSAESALIDSTGRKGTLGKWCSPATNVSHPLPKSAHTISWWVSKPTGPSPVASTYVQNITWEKLHSHTYTEREREREYRNSHTSKIVPTN